MSSSDHMGETQVSLLSDAQGYLQVMMAHCAPDSELAVAWAGFYRTYSALIRKFVVSCGVREADVKDCVQDVWTKSRSGSPPSADRRIVPACDRGSTPSCAARRRTCSASPITPARNAPTTTRPPDDWAALRPGRRIPPRENPDPRVANS